MLIFQFVVKRKKFSWLKLGPFGKALKPGNGKKIKILKKLTLKEKKTGYWLV